jgi:hypothetical protein
MGSGYAESGSRRFPHEPFEQRLEPRTQVQFLAFLLQHPARITRSLE